MAQIQNLQLNGNLAQLQMPNGLNGQFISQLPAQFQQSVTGFNQFNQLNSASFQQLAAAAAAAGTAFQSPPPSAQQTSDMVVTAGPNIQFTTQPTSINVTQSLQPQSQLIAMPSQQTQLIPEHELSFINKSMSAECKQSNSTTTSSSSSQLTLSQPMVRQPVVDTVPTVTAPPAKPARKPKKSKATKKNATATVQATAKGLMQSAPVTSTGKLDLANVMKLCGIDDEDFMDTDDIQPTAAPPSSTASTPHTTYDANTNADIMVTIPYSHNSDAPFSFTIPTVSSHRYISDGQSTTLKTSMAGGRSFAETIPTMSLANDSSKPSDRQYMINIDNNDGTPPFPLSISLPHNLEPIDKTLHGKMQVAAVNAQPGNAMVSMTSHPVTSISQMNHVIVQQPHTTSSMVTTPTLQSQINDIQNQLIGVDQRSNLSSQYVMIPSSNAASVVITSAIAAKPISTTTTTTTTTATIAKNVTNVPKTTKKKPAARRNGKKVVEPTINVPSQIGNIQISQIDRSKMTQGANVKAPTTIDNHIQITPILDTMKPAPILTQSATSQPSQNHSSISMNAILPSTVTQQQQQPQAISITNNMQIITTSGSHLNTHGSVNHSGGIISSTNHTVEHNHNGGIIINTQSQHPQLIATQNSHQQQQQQPRPMQMAIQSGPSPNVHIQMASQSDHANATPQMPVIPQLTGSLTLSFSEDGRLLLKHNANAPQDAQSQMILQAILSGALCNVTLINEPTTTASMMPPQPTPNCVDVKPSIIVKNDPLPMATGPSSISTSNSMHTKMQNHHIVTNPIDKQQQQQHQPMV